MMQPLRNYIRQNLSHIRSSPCVLISSAPPPPTISTAVAGTRDPYSIGVPSKDEDREQQRRERKERLKFQQRQDNAVIRTFVERNTQSIALEFNLRTVPCTISSAFPTLQSVDEAVSLAKRGGLKGGGGAGSPISGHGIVIGIGSGAAMELAKAVADNLFGNIGVYHDTTGAEAKGGGSLVLAPCTLGGLWAATSNSPSLLLDVKEEMILPHWHKGNSSRRLGTVVTLDTMEQLAMPPLYTPSQPMKRSEYSAAPSMAHVAAAALAIVLDVARSVDAATEVQRSKEDKQIAALRLHVRKELEEIASSCASVLQLASQVANDDCMDTSSHQIQAQQQLVNVIPRLSPLVEQTSLLAQTPMVALGTIPQKLAGALLPRYFPQCHILTYLASILPGLCDMLAANSGQSSDSGDNMLMIESVSNSIINYKAEVYDYDGSASSSLSSWATHLISKAGMPSMGSLAFGTPDLNALMGSLDSHDALMASIYGGEAVGNAVMDDHLVMADILKRSLSR